MKANVLLLSREDQQHIAQVLDRADALAITAWVHIEQVRLGISSATRKQVVPLARP